jgi:catechol 2,3-dioxygenase-like lactoylglutathione lyase family enzyme
VQSGHGSTLARPPHPGEHVCSDFPDGSACGVLGNAETDPDAEDQDRTMNTGDAKLAARILRRELAARGVQLTHGEALELIAHQLGHRDWNTAVAQTTPEIGAALGSPVPVLRVQDADHAVAFYTEQLGFTELWRHRFEPDLPLYVRIRRDNTDLDLSEHYGDGTPGSVVWIPVRDAANLRQELLPRLEPRQRPGLDRNAPGGPTFTVIDPYSNTLRFCQTDA